MERTFPPHHPENTITPRPGAIALPLPDALRGIATARHAAHRLRLYPQAAPLRDLADALERSLPPTVPRAALARALGVTPKTVARWAEANRVPLAQAGPRARLGVPAAFAVAAVTETERLRHLSRQRRTRLVGHALRNLGNRASGV